ncbi:MAG: zinc ABC transporter substrate-binding protein [Anaerolineae bacterium]
MMERSQLDEETRAAHRGTAARGCTGFRSDLRPQVVASFSILADVAHNVAGDAADVIALIPPDADPHAYTPTPNDLATVADADVVLISGAEFEQGLLTTIASVLGDKAPVVASACVEILPFGEVPANARARRGCRRRAALRRPRRRAGRHRLARTRVPDARQVVRAQLHGCSGREEGNCDPHVG